MVFTKIFADNGRMAKTIRDEFLEFLEETGMSVAEFSRQSGASRDALNKIKQRETGGTSDENALKIRALIAAYRSSIGGFAEPSAPQPRIDVSHIPTHIPEPKNRPDDDTNSFSFAIVNGVLQIAATVDKDGWLEFAEQLDHARQMIGADPLQKRSSSQD